MKREKVKMFCTVRMDGFSVRFMVLSGIYSIHETGNQSPLEMVDVVVYLNLQSYAC